MRYNDSNLGDPRDTREDKLERELYSTTQELRRLHSEVERLTQLLYENLREKHAVGMVRDMKATTNNIKEQQEYMHRQINITVQRINKLLKH